MKKILCLALALTVVLSLSLSVAAFADVSVTGENGHGVNAKYVPDTSLKATVNWGVMNFTYTEATSTWSVESQDVNKVSVTNNSKYGNIKVTAGYSDDTGDGVQSGNYEPRLFSSSITSFKPRETSTEGATRDLVTFFGAPFIESLDPSATADRWLMFTNDISIGTLKDIVEFTKVGTLRLTIQSPD